MDEHDILRLLAEPKTLKEVQEYGVDKDVLIRLVHENKVKRIIIGHNIFFQINWLKIWEDDSKD